MSLSSPAIISRKKIVLLGFFGRGNAGDEAFLHAQHQVLSKEFDLIIAVDRNAARPDCYSWAPYNHTDCWSYDEFGRVFHEKDIHGVHIGGGSLPFGFAAQFSNTALDAGKAVVISGVDASINPRMPGYKVKRFFYEQINLIAVRNENHFKALRGLETGMLGADWALGLAVEPQGDPIDIALTVRESGEATDDHFAAYRRIIDYLERQGRNVRFVPFAPEDDALLDRMDIPHGRREIHWHDPRTVLGRLAMSNMVVSMGRLHTLILAVMAGKPAISIDPSVYRGGALKKNHKNRLAADTFGLRHFDNTDAFLEEAPVLADIQAGAHGMPEGYQQRFDAMAERVVSAFVNHKARGILPKEIPIREAEKYWAGQTESA